MTTQEIANHYYELANQSNWAEIQKEFHDENIINREPEHVAERGMQVETKGRAALWAKSAANREMIQTIHTQTCSKPLVAGDFFTLVLTRDMTLKNGPRVQKEEVGVFQVKNGKIIQEQFFY